MDDGTDPSAIEPGALGEPPTLEEVECLHRLLTKAEREELLECLLLAAPNGGDSVIRALTPWLLVASAHELMDPADE
ncbi:MAG: hypothetical protein JXA87_15820 [Thermoleophilia bacterium]|nr:hypothetical protein [Thermoleophilia bacterium]